MKRNGLWTLALVVAALALVALLSCESSSGSDDDSDAQRPTCDQATDCGPEGRSLWVCSPDGRCYTIFEYCYYDHECVGNCVNYVCEGGKINEPDQPIIDGDTDDDTPETPDQIPCEFECCTNADCDEDAFCDTERNTCQRIIPCEEGKQCCQDYDCWIKPEFGDGFICRFNTCVDPDNPCPFECCETEDCITKYGESYYCILAEGPDQGTCRSGTLSCDPGAEICCFNDTGNPDCNALGYMRSEAILTCNPEGNDYILTMCPQHHDCFPDRNNAGKVVCEANGRCSTTDDCECPNQCVETPNGTRCMIPPVNEGDVCAEDRCGTGEPVLVGYCPEGFQCCVDGQTGVGTCGNCR